MYEVSGVTTEQEEAAAEQVLEQGKEAGGRGTWQIRNNGTGEGGGRGLLVRNWETTVKISIAQYKAPYSTTAEQHWEDPSWVVNAQMYRCSEPSGSHRL